MNADFQLHLSEKVGALPLSDEDKKRVIDIAFWAMEQVAQPKTPAVLCANCGMPIGQHAEDAASQAPSDTQRAARTELHDAISKADYALWVMLEHSTLHHGDKHSNVTLAREALNALRSAVRNAGVQGTVKESGNG